MKLSTLLLSCSVTLCAVIGSSPLAHADVRIATVDISRVINEAPDAVAKRKELDVASEDAKKKLEAKGKELQALQTKLESQKTSPDSKEAESFRNQARDFERLRADMKADLEKKYMKFNKELTDKVLGKIETYAKSNNYDLVLDKSEKYRGPVLFGNTSADITDDIIKLIK
jgi:outer membrane protein